LYSRSLNLFDIYVPSTLRLYNKPKVKNWDLTLIKTGLKVDDNGYNTIYAALNEELVNQNLFRLKLNMVARKRYLEFVLENIIQ
jgi:hypothetical protein